MSQNALKIASNRHDNEHKPPLSEVQLYVCYVHSDYDRESAKHAHMHGEFSHASLCVHANSTVDMTR